MDMLTASRTDKQKKETENHKRELKSADKRIAELDKIITKLYADSALGRIDEQRATSMMTAYEQEQQALKSKQQTLHESIDRAEEVYSNVQNFISLIKKYTDISELTTINLNELIDKIVVHEKVIGEDGSKSQAVDIHYKFIGYTPMAEWIAGANTINGYSIAELMADESKTA